MVLDNRDDVLRRRAAAFPLFDPVEYRRVNPDTGPDVLDHLLRIGLPERRRLARPEKVAAWLARLTEAGDALAPPPAPAAAASAIARLSRAGVRIHASPTSRTGAGELARALSAGLDRLGVRADVLDGPEPVATGAGPTVLVAPAEFDGVDGAPPPPSPEASASSVILSERAPADADFFRHLEPLLRARGVIALDPALAQACRAAGVPAAYWVPAAAPTALGTDAAPDHPLIAGLPRAARRPRARPDLWAERPLDLMLLVDESEARAEFIGRHADWLAGLACVLRFRRTLWTLPGEPLIPLGVADYIGARCRIVLNLHEGEVGGLQPLAVAHGIARGALVVSAPCLPHPLFRPGEHYLEESPGRIPKLVDWLLHTPEGQGTAERVRMNAMTRLVEVASPRRLALGVAELLAGGWVREPA